MKVQDIACTTRSRAVGESCCCVVAISRRKQKIFNERSIIGMTGRRDPEMKKTPASRLHAEWLHEQLQDSVFAAEYLSAAAEDEPAVYLGALRHVAEAHGMTKVAKAAGIPRESLYRALSPKGNPRLSTLTAIMRAAGMKLSAEANTSRKKPAVKRRVTAAA